MRPMKYDVWQAFDGPWDETQADRPEMSVDAFGPEDAARKFAERKHFDDEIAVIVRDEAGRYYELEMTRRWECDTFNPKTLKELCTP